MRKIYAWHRIFHIWRNFIVIVGGSKAVSLDINFICKLLKHKRPSKSAYLAISGGIFETLRLNTNNIIQGWIIHPTKCDFFFFQSVLWKKEDEDLYKRIFHALLVFFFLFLRFPYEGKVLQNGRWNEARECSFNSLKRSAFVTINFYYLHSAYWLIWSTEPYLPFVA